MNRFLGFLTLATCTVCLGQTPQTKCAATAQIEPKIESGATAYIEPNGGYETYLAAAFTKEHLPLVLVTDKDKAEYIITSKVAHKDSRGQPAVVINNSNTNVANANAEGHPSFAQQVWDRDTAATDALGESVVSIEVTDAHPSQILFAYATGKKGANQFQKTAEDCAKHLKKFIAKKLKK